MRFGSFWSLSVVWVRLMLGRIARLERTQLCGDSQALQVPCHPAGSSCEPAGSTLSYCQKHWTFQDPGWFWFILDLLLGPSSNGSGCFLHLKEIQLCCLYALCFAQGKPLQSLHLCQDLVEGRVEIAKVLQGLNLGLKTAAFQQVTIIWVRSFESLISWGKMFTSIGGFGWHLWSQSPVGPPTIGDASVSISVNAVWPLSRSLNTDIATRDGLENLGEKNGNNPKSHGFYLVIGVSLKNCHFRDVPHFSWDKPSCKVLQVGKLNTQLEAVQGSFEVDVALELFRESVDLLTEDFELVKMKLDLLHIRKTCPARLRMFLSQNWEEESWCYRPLDDCMWFIMIHVLNCCW